MYRAAEDPERVVTTRIDRWSGEDHAIVDDAIVVEEPLEIYLADQPLAVIMRTPGHDDELALGFLHGEGLIRHADDVRALGLWRDARGAFAQHRVTLALRDAPQSPGTWQRSFYATSSCGMCGRASIDAALRLAPPLDRRLSLPPSAFYPLPDRLRETQTAFDRTGGLHAAALFDTAGALRAVREDVGRHNAVDKLVGRALIDRALPLSGTILLVSGRVSFEIIQKALVARIPAIAAISAPSSLAVSAARRANIALVGFLRSGRLNVYA